MVVLRNLLMQQAAYKPWPLGDAVYKHIAIYKPLFLCCGARGTCTYKPDYGITAWLAKMCIPCGGSQGKITRSRCFGARGCYVCSNTGVVNTVGVKNTLFPFHSVPFRFTGNERAEKMVCRSARSVLFCSVHSAF